MKNRIYLDYAATTPVDPRVLEEMLPFFSSQFGNAASIEHRYGWDADEAVKKGRKRIADLIQAQPNEIVFTSGATEANNLAIKGFAKANQDKGNHIISCVVEHKSVLDTITYLKTEGWNITLLKVEPDGSLNIDELERSIAPETILISMMAANNEIGTLHPIKEIGEIAQKHGIKFHSDATQAVGKAPINVTGICVDLLSMSAHKIYGPKGIGALYIKKSNPPIAIEPLLHGGGHEGGMRSGTLNVPGIVGFGSACYHAKNELEEEASHLQDLKEKLYRGLIAGLDEVTLNGRFSNSLPGILNVSFKNVENSDLIRDLKNIAISSGSACTSEVIGPSHVIEALGVRDRSSVRFSLGRFTSEEEIERVIEKVVRSVKELRGLV